jgi:hypothetical protein
MKLDCLAVGLTRDSLPASVAQSPNAFEMSGHQTKPVHAMSGCLRVLKGAMGRMVCGLWTITKARFATITTDMMNGRRQAGCRSAALMKA